jgi:hypothetical protein
MLTKPLMGLFPRFLLVRNPRRAWVCNAAADKRNVRLMEGQHFRVPTKCSCDTQTRGSAGPSALPNEVTLKYPILRTTYGTIGSLALPKRLSSPFCNRQAGPSLKSHLFSNRLQILFPLTIAPIKMGHAFRGHKINVHYSHEAQNHSNPRFLKVAT